MMSALEIKNTDDVVAYLLKSKKETLEQMKNYALREDVQKAMKLLDNRNKKQCIKHRTHPPTHPTKKTETAIIARCCAR